MKKIVLVLLISSFFCWQTILADNYEIAEKAFYNQQYAFAINYYQKEIVDNGFYREESFYKIVLAYSQLNNMQKSQVAIKNYLQEYPQGQYFLQIKFKQANLLLEKKNYGAVLNLAKSILEKYADEEESSLFYILLYKVYLQKGFTDLALESLAKVNEKYQQEADFAKGLYYYQQKKYKKAIRLLRNIKLDQLVSTSDKNVLYYRAQSYHQLKDYEYSREEIKKYFANIPELLSTNKIKDTLLEMSPKTIELNFLLYKNFFLEKNMPM